MATPRHLSRAPIVEALIDIRIEEPIPSPDTLRGLAQSLSGSYPIIEPHKAFQTTFKAADGKASVDTTDLGLRGYFLRTAARDRLVQFRVDGFTLNSFPPYTSADDLIAEALTLWTEYSRAVGPKSVVRLAMRYINKLILPFRDGEDYKRFLTTAPEVPSELPQGVTEFSTKVVLQYADDAAVIISQALTGAVPAEMIIDIDVFRGGSFELSAASLSPILFKLREIKNTAFFALLTEEAAKLYQ